MPLTQAKPTFKAPPMAAQTRSQRSAIMPAPMQGLDISQPLVAQNPQGAVILDNFFCRRYGVELRAGSQRWTTNLGGALTPSPVISLMAYNPPRGAQSQYEAKLFAACGDGNIYDVTDRTDEAFEPPVAVTIPGQLEPGELSWTNYATLATNYLCVCVSGGGYWTYDSVGGWVDRTGSIAGAGGPSAPNFDFVFAWKNRLWFVVDNTSDAYYLGSGNIAGQATNFDFGPLFVHGGDLKAMASWTVDAGDGIDDKMVVVSGAGDVLVYQGTDPSSATAFGIIGRWFIGRPPNGRRFMGKYGGDLSIITERGIEFMSRLIGGMGNLDPQSQGTDMARRFNEIIGRDVRATRNQNFWNSIYVSGEECVITLTPYNKIGSGGRQYCFSPLAQGWSRMIGLPMACGEEFRGDLYYGTLEGTVAKAFYGNSDGELTDGTAGRPILGEIQTSFVAPAEDRMSLKRALLVQPQFQAPSPPQFKVAINTEWSVKGVPGAPSYNLNVDALWDQANWDQAVWSGDQNTYQLWVGVSGLGSYASLRMNVQGAPGTIFTSWKYVWESGGIM